jgi:hypothetical protein
MNPRLPQRVVDTMAKRVYRMHLFLWYQLRYMWVQYPNDLRQKIRELGWAPPRPAFDDRGFPLVSNDSGEDFLYMNKQLITHVNNLLAEIGDPAYPRVDGWVTLPPPSDREFPVPPAWFSPEAPDEVLQRVPLSKLDISYERVFKHWERLCNDPTFLRRASLGRIGAVMQAPLEEGVRLRWSSAPGAWRPTPAAEDPETIPLGWDDPQYDFLHDFYAMHVNPIYWMFHGWVDDRVEDWKVANGVFGNAFWKATWLGKVPDPQHEGASVFAAFDDPDRAQQHITEMEQVIRLIAETGTFLTT